MPGFHACRLIDPSTGKLPLEGPREDVLQGATFKGSPVGWSDFPKPHTRAVPPPAEPITHRIINGTAAGDDWARMGRRPMQARPEPGPSDPLPRSDNLYAHMTYK